MKKYFKFIFLSVVVLSVSFLLTSCATIFKGSTDAVTFTSEPTGANVYVNGMNMGKAPISLELKSNKTYNIEFRLEGHETKNVILNNSIGGGYIVLDVLFGLFPVIIDAATGNWYSLDQEHVNAILEKQK